MKFVWNHPIIKFSSTDPAFSDSISADIAWRWHAGEWAFRRSAIIGNSSLQDASGTAYGAATHAVFPRSGTDFFARGEFDGLVITDSIPLPASMTATPLLTIIDSSALFAEAIARAHRGR